MVLESNGYGVGEKIESECGVPRACQLPVTTV
jgi:hypothetical protein